MVLIFICNTQVAGRMSQILGAFARVKLAGSDNGAALRAGSYLHTYSDEYARMHKYTELAALRPVVCKVTNMCIRMCIHTHVHMFVPMYVHVYVYLYTHIKTHLSVCIMCLL